MASAVICITIISTLNLNRHYKAMRISISNQEVLRLLNGLRNGLEYGSKVRFIHSLVMTLLFKSFGKKEIANIFRLALEHGRNLGLFVCFFKATCLLLSKLWGEKAINHFLSGFLVGGLIFGKKTPVNYQIVLYLFSRVVIGLTALIYKNYCQDRWSRVQKPLERKYGNMVLAALCWGTVMWLFRVDKSVLQASLTSSMNYLYIESDNIYKKWAAFIPYVKAKK